MLRLFFKLGLPTLLIAISLTVLAAYLRPKMHLTRTSDVTHVVLVGASIGQSWRLEDWASRTRIPGFTAESVAAWQFDKTEVIEEVLLRPALKFRLNRSYLKSLLHPPTPPNIVLLKECSSYFPGDLQAYQNSFRQWTNRVQGRGLQVMVATVVPVTRVRSDREPGKQEGLLEFNSWLRTFAAKRGIPVLDLEAALRSAAAGSYLREEFATPDGSHLNPSAYRVLDAVLANTLLPVSRASIH